MKRDPLESFINDNRHEFDPMEPSDKVWEKISSRLEQEQPSVEVPSRRLTWLRVAVMIGVVLLVPAILYTLMKPGQKQTVKAIVVDPEVQELMEAEAYYAQEVTGKMQEIEKCYQVNPELRMEIEGDLNELEAMYRSLKNDLRDNIANKEVIEAMIENNRNRVKIVDEVLEQINC